MERPEGMSRTLAMVLVALFLITGVTIPKITAPPVVASHRL